MSWHPIRRISDLTDAPRPIYLYYSKQDSGFIALISTPNVPCKTDISGHRATHFWVGHTVPEIGPHG